MRALTALGLGLVAGLVLGCGRSEPPVPEAGAAGAVREWFDLARAGEPAEERLGRLLDPALQGADRAPLLDALAVLAASGPADRIVLEQLAGPDEVVADVETDLAGGGSARYSLELRRIEDGTWRVVWFQGPGVAWPRGGGRSDEGLSVSAEPASSTALAP